MSQITIGNLPEKDYFVQSEIDRLRVNIGFLGEEKKMIMVTSSEPDEGKSYISVSIWDELAKAGKKVCFVDMDMRKSVLRSELHLKTEKEEFIGLSHYLAGQCKVSDIIYTTERENAFLIPTITLINPSILLEGARFDALLKGLRDAFDYVILDTPPLGLVSDGQLIAGKCDGCILVVRAHKTGRAAVREAVMQLRRVDCPLLGVVLNRMEFQHAKGYYRKGYYRGYGKGYYSKGYYSNAESESS